MPARMKTQRSWGRAERSSRRTERLAHNPLDAVRAAIALAAITLITSGCALAPGQQPMAAHWPDLDHVGRAAVDAARDPNTWVPLAGAALLAIDDFDEQLSDWAIEHQPLFGSDAGDISHDLKDATLGLWFVSALAVPSDGWRGKLGGLGVGAVTLAVEGGSVELLKDLTRRERPDGSNDRSMPSGHASSAAARTRLTRANLQRIDMAPWLRTTANVGLYGMAFATSWARVEAGKHHPTDVLVGYAFGNFVASFAHKAFLEQQVEGAELSFAPLDGGGMLTLKVPLRI